MDNIYQSWQVSTSSHYAEETLNAFKERIQNFFQKNINSPNVSEIRPIEELRTKTKLKVIKNDWPTDSTPKLGH